MSLGLGGFNPYQSGSSGSSGSYSGYGGYQGYGGYNPPTGIPPTSSSLPKTSWSTPTNPYNLPTLNLNVPRDPLLGQVFGNIESYRGKLAAGTDVDAINAMQRQRDLASGEAGEIGQGAALRLGPGSGVEQSLRAKAIMQGGRDAAALNAAMTSDARRQQLAALGQESGVASASAAALAAQQGYLLQQWTAAAQLSAMQQQNAFNNAMAMARFYTGA